MTEDTMPPSTIRLEYADGHSETLTTDILVTRLQRAGEVNQRYQDALQRIAQGNYGPAKGQACAHGNSGDAGCALCAAELALAALQGE